MMMRKNKYDQRFRLGSSVLPTLFADIVRWLHKSFLTWTSTCLFLFLSIIIMQLPCIGALKILKIKYRHSRELNSEIQSFYIQLRVMHRHHTEQLSQSLVFQLETLASESQFDQLGARFIFYQQEHRTQNFPMSYPQFNSATSFPSHYGSDISRPVQTQPNSIQDLIFQLSKSKERERYLEAQLKRSKERERCLEAQLSESKERERCLEKKNTWLAHLHKIFSSDNESLVATNDQLERKYHSASKQVRQQSNPQQATISTQQSPIHTQHIIHQSPIQTTTTHTKPLKKQSLAFFTYRNK